MTAVDYDTLPDDGDEDDEPLFDSTRDYVEQINRYKEHQGKPIERRRKGAAGAAGGVGGQS
jgi:hypothetical protein